MGSRQNEALDPALEALLAGSPTGGEVKRLLAQLKAYREGWAKEKKRRTELEQRLKRKRQRKARTHLIIPDAHADLAEESNDRFDWLGRMIVELRPDVVVCLGDLADMGSLCAYEKPGSLAAEGRRVVDDIQSARDAISRLSAPVRGQNGYSPELHALIGNHEYRIVKAATEDVRWAGVIHLKDLGWEDAGWEVTPFEAWRLIDGVAYSHYATRQNTNRPFAGKYHSNALLVEGGGLSTVVGHSHLRDYREITRWDGSRAFALVAGCYFERHAHWASQSNAGWWRGVFVLRDVLDGYPQGGVDEWPMERIKERFA